MQRGKAKKELLDKNTERSRRAQPSELLPQPAIFPMPSLARAKHPASGKKQANGAVKLEDPKSEKYMFELINLRTLVLKLGKEREDALSDLEALKLRNSELEKELSYVRAEVQVLQKEAEAASAKAELSQNMNSVVAELRQQVHELSKELQSAQAALQAKSHCEIHPESDDHSAARSVNSATRLSHVQEITCFNPTAGPTSYQAEPLFPPIGRSRSGQSPNSHFQLPMPPRSSGSHPVSSIRLKRLSDSSSPDTSLISTPSPMSRTFTQRIPSVPEFEPFLNPQITSPSSSSGPYEPRMIQDATTEMPWKQSPKVSGELRDSVKNKSGHAKTLMLSSPTTSLETICFTPAPSPSPTTALETICFTPAPSSSPSTPINPPAPLHARSVVSPHTPLHTTQTSCDDNTTASCPEPASTEAVLPVHVAAVDVHSASPEEAVLPVHVAAADVHSASPEEAVLPVHVAAVDCKPLSPEPPLPDVDHALSCSAISLKDIEKSCNAACGPPCYRCSSKGGQVGIESRLGSPGKLLGGDVGATWSLQEHQANEQSSSNGSQAVRVHNPLATYATSPASDVSPSLAHIHTSVEGLADESILEYVADAVTSCDNLLRGDSSELSSSFEVEAADTSSMNGVVCSEPVGGAVDVFPSQEQVHKGMKAYRVGESTHGVEPKLKLHDGVEEGYHLSSAVCCHAKGQQGLRMQVVDEETEEYGDRGDHQGDVISNMAPATQHTEVCNEHYSSAPEGHDVHMHGLEEQQRNLAMTSQSELEESEKEAELPGRPLVDGSGATYTNNNVSSGLLGWQDQSQSSGSGTWIPLSRRMSLPGGALTHFVDVRLMDKDWGNLAPSALAVENPPRRRRPFSAQIMGYQTMGSVPPRLNSTACRPGQEVQQQQQPGPSISRPLSATSKLLSRPGSAQGLIPTLSASRKGLMGGSGSVIKCEGAITPSMACRDEIMGAS